MIYTDPTGHFAGSEGMGGAGGGWGGGSNSSDSGSNSSGGGFWGSIGGFFSAIGNALQEGGQQVNDAVGYALENNIDFMSFSGLRQAEQGLADQRAETQARLDGFYAEQALQQYNAIYSFDLNSALARQAQFESIAGFLACNIDTCSVGVSYQELERRRNAPPYMNKTRSKLFAKRTKYQQAIARYRLKKTGFAIIGTGTTVLGVLHANPPLVVGGFSMAVENAWNAIMGEHEEISLPLIP